MKTPLHIVPVILILTLISSCNPKTEQRKTAPLSAPVLIWVGTYTDAPEHGIHLISLDTTTMKFDSVLVQNEVKNPSFVVANKTGDLLFSVQETGGENGGSVCSFKYDRSKQTLQKLSTVSSLGSGPCHIALAPSEKHILVGNYSSGNLAVIPVQEDGTLSEAVQEFKHKGSSINTSRQEKPHVHSLVFHPDGKKVFVGDLGTDRVYVYDWTADQKNPLKAASPAYFEVEPGSGPRHLALNPDGDKIYVIYELTAEVGLFDYQQEKDQYLIHHLDTYPLTGDDFSGNVGAAEIRLSPDGKFLYASNRGDANDITGFEIDQTSGKLKLIQTVKSGGKTPRNFALTKDGGFVIVGNQHSHRVELFKRDKLNGKITPTQTNIAIHKPVYFFLD